MDGHNSQLFDIQGSRFGISQHTVDLAKAFSQAIVDGNLPLPMDQGQAENALMHGYLLPVIDLMCQFPDFIHIAVAYCNRQYMFVPSPDSDVCIFQIL